MIDVTITENSIEAKGHASDSIVCNTVSTLMWTLAISLTESCAECVEVTENDGYQKVSYKRSEKADPIFDGIKKCLVLLSEDFKEELSIK